MTRLLTNRPQTLQIAQPRPNLSSRGLPEPYAHRLDDPQIQRFLQTVPWHIDCTRQAVGPLINSMKRDHQRLSEHREGPLLSLVTPSLHGPRSWFDDLAKSILCQSYPHWEWVILAEKALEPTNKTLLHSHAERDPRIRVIVGAENLKDADADRHAHDLAQGDYLITTGIDQVLHPMALGWYAKSILTRPELDIITANEACLTSDSRRVYNFFYKPQFDWFTLLNFNYLGALTAIARNRLNRIEEQSESLNDHLASEQDPESLAHAKLLSLAGLKDLSTHHLPLTLNYRRSSEKANPGNSSRRAAKLASLTSLHRAAGKLYPDWEISLPTPSDADQSLQTGMRFQARPTSLTSPSQLLIVIPFRDQVAMTLDCLNGIEGQNHRLRLHVILVDNGSSDPSTFQSLKDWLKLKRKATYHIIHDQGAFNFARLNNRAVRESGFDSDLILLLNNDVVLDSRDLLEAMANHLLAHPQAGFVGVRLNYPQGGGIQHGGMRVWESVTGSGHYILNHALHDHEFVHLDRLATGVTFACAMCRRSLWDELGGLEEKHWPNGFGDVDACLRAIERGYRNYYLGSLTATHHESPSRGVIDEQAELALIYQRHAATLARERLNHLLIWPDPHWPTVSPPHPEAMSARAYPRRYPLRYRIADEINSACKHYVRGVHRWLRMWIPR